MSYRVGEKEERNKYIGREEKEERNQYIGREETVG